MLGLESFRVGRRGAAERRHGGTLPALSAPRGEAVSPPHGLPGQLAGTTAEAPQAHSTRGPLLWAARNRVTGWCLGV